MKLTNTRCECAGRHGYFSSTSAFDKHRTWANDNGAPWSGRHRPPDYDRRACLKPEEVGLVERNGIFDRPSTRWNAGNIAVETAA